MKKETGVTLIALIVYIMVLTFAVAGVTSITASFYNSINEFDASAENSSNFAKFNMYMINDIKSEKVRLNGDISKNEFQLLISNNGQSSVVRYSVKNNTLYRNDVKICDNIIDATFSGVNGTDTEEKSKITVTLKMKNYEKTSTYILEPKTVV